MLYCKLFNNPILQTPFIGSLLCTQAGCFCILDPLTLTVANSHQAGWCTLI